MGEDMERIGDRIAEQAAHLDAAMQRLLADIRAFDAGFGWHDQGAQSCAHWLSWRIGWTPGTAREHVRVARRLGELPAIDDALRRGEVSCSKVRAMTRVATADNEAQLLSQARFTTAAQLETICRKVQTVQRLAESDPQVIESRRAVTRRTLDDGMVKIEAVLRPEEAARVWGVIGKTADQRADGLVAIAEAFARGDASSGRTPV